MDKRIVKRPDELDRTARHYGRAYQCLRCLYKDGVNRIDVKRRIEAHITKYHLSLDEVGHYCRLCSFRCWDRKTLEDHVRFYARHRRMAKEQGVTGKEEDLLVSNRQPYEMGAADYVVLSKERSLDFFKGKQAANPIEDESQDESYDVVQEAARLAGVTEETETAASNLVVTLLQGGPGTSEEAAVPAVSPSLPEAGAETAPAQTEPLDLTIQTEPEEDILGQLLGESTVRMTPLADRPKSVRQLSPDREEPPAKRKRHQTAHRRPSRSRSPSPVPSEASSQSSASSTASITAEQWQEIGKNIMKPLHEAVDQNTRAIRVLGKSVETLTRAVEVIARSCKGMQEALEERTRQGRDNNRSDRVDKTPRRRPDEPRRGNRY